MWGLFEYLRNHNRSYEALRDVGAAQPAYEQTWRTVQQAFAEQKARRKLAPALVHAPAKSPGKTGDKPSRPAPQPSATATR
jgi:hypothetical protein